MAGTDSSSRHSETSSGATDTRTSFSCATGSARLANLARIGRTGDDGGGEAFLGDLGNMVPSASHTPKDHGERARDRLEKSIAWGTGKGTKPVSEG